MKLLQRLMHYVLHLNAQEQICSACCYYDDAVIDDENAFIEGETRDRGWILDYMKRKFGK